MFIIWFDGLDWPTTQAAAIVKTCAKAYTEGRGFGACIFQEGDGVAVECRSMVSLSPARHMSRICRISTRNSRHPNGLWLWRRPDAADRRVRTWSRARWDRKARAP